MQFYVFKNNEQVGPFALMDVRERLQRGEFAYEDLAWREGMANWTPLREILGGALPDATPHAVSEWTAHNPVPAKTPIVARIATAVLFFVVYFFVIYFVVAIACFMIGGGISGMHSATQANAQGFNQGYALGQKAGAQFRHDWRGIIVVGSFAFSFVASPIAAYFTAFSSLLPWCRKR